MARARPTNRRTTSQCRTARASARIVVSFNGLIPPVKTAAPLVPAACVDASSARGAALGIQIDSRKP